MSIPSLVKQPSEDRLYSMDFSALLERDENIDSIVSVTASPVGLTLSEQAFAGTMAQVRIAGGTAHNTYKVTFVVTTSDGNTLEGEGNLVVRNM